MLGFDWSEKHSLYSLEIVRSIHSDGVTCVEEADASLHPLHLVTIT